MSSSIPNSDQVRSWLNDLSHTETGSICMVNMFLCWKHNVVPEDRIKAFISSCLSAGAVGNPEDIFHEVCERDDGTELPFFGLAAIKKNRMRGKVRLSSTIKTVAFHHHLLARSYKEAPPGLDLKVLNPLPQTIDEEQEFVEELRRITANPDWFEPGASLGKPFPFPIYCWFTLATQLHRIANGGPAGNTTATQARDWLGLIDREDGEQLLEVAFTSEWLKTVSYLKVARPTFADGGNHRFAAFQDGAGSKRNHSRGWGTTVHLGKLAKKSKNMCGLPERVSSSVPISAKAFTVTYLGRVKGTRGLMAGVDDHAAFEARLRGSVSVPEIIELLTKAVTS
jgi:hypothetical protein